MKLSTFYDDPAAENMAELLTHFVHDPSPGVTPRPLGDVPLDEARRLFDVRFWGAAAAVRHAAPRIRAGSSDVLTSSTVAVRLPAGAALLAAGAAAIEAGWSGVRRG
jgi:NAD(P)-dependent dehydrogenase (short-subunit alcohol dehydrogenase family)